MLYFHQSARVIWAHPTQPPDPSWGAMLYTSRSYLRRAWWYGFFPGLFLTVLVLGFNMFSEALRDALDPARRHLL